MILWYSLNIKKDSLIPSTVHNRSALFVYYAAYGYVWMDGLIYMHEIDLCMFICLDVCISLCSEPLNKTLHIWLSTDPYD